MKIRIIKESLAQVSIDKNFVDSMGFILGVELGRGQFGLVYSILIKNKKKNMP